MMLKIPDRDCDIHPLKPPLPSPLQLLVVQGQDKNAELVLKTIEETIEEIGVVVEWNLADTATACQQLLQTRHYDAVLWDYQMPDFSALDLLQCENAIAIEGISRSPLWPSVFPRCSFSSHF